MRDFSAVRTRRIYRLQESWEPSDALDILSCIYECLIAIVESEQASNSIQVELMEDEDPYIEVRGDENDVFDLLCAASIDAYGTDSLIEVWLSDNDPDIMMAYLNYDGLLGTAAMD